MRFREKSDSISNIDISPLIDMVFILLIFFMVSTTFQKDMKIDIERPGASSSTSASTKAVRVYLDSAGDVSVDGQPVRLWMLQSRVKDMLKAASQKTVLVVTDRRVSAEKLIEVVDQCRLGGAAEVAVATGAEAGD